MSLKDYSRFPVGLPVAGSVADPNSRGYVYVIGFDEADIVKIGSTKTLGLRLTELQCGSPFQLHLRSAVSIYEGDPCAVEYAAHSLAKEYGAHIRGEWFEIEPDNALRCIIEAAKSKRVRYGPQSRNCENEMKADQVVAAQSEDARLSALRRKLGMDC